MLVGTTRNLIIIINKQAVTSNNQISHNLEVMVTKIMVIHRAPLYHQRKSPFSSSNIKCNLPRDKINLYPNLSSSNLNKLDHLVVGQFNKNLAMLDIVIHHMDEMSLLVWVVEVEVFIG